MGQMPDKPVKWTHGKLNRWQLLYLSLCAVLALSNGIVGYVAITTSQETHEVQCSAKIALEESIDGSEEFLEHPEKFPQFNEPAVIKLTKAKVESEQARLDALADADCD